MKLNHFIEYLFIGTLYLIPYFIVHYTLSLRKCRPKTGFVESVTSAYGRLPGFFRGNISLEIKNPSIPILLLLFLLIVTGAVSNGILYHLDDAWLKGLQRVFPSSYMENKKTDNYTKPIKAMFRYDKKEVGDLIGKIRFQKIVTRHGLAHSLIIFLCLPFILANRQLNLGAKLIWIALSCLAFTQAVNGFLAVIGWYEGVLDTILMTQP